jgi:hypothetical protein
LARHFAKSRSKNEAATVRVLNNWFTKGFDFALILVNERDMIRLITVFIQYPIFFNVSMSFSLVFVPIAPMTLKVNKKKF